MESIKRESKYSLVAADDVDLGNESDTTACSTGSAGKVRGPRREIRVSSKQISRAEIFLTWARWAFVVVLQLVILTVVIIREPGGNGAWEVETGGDINGLYKPTSHKVTFLAPEFDMYMPNFTSDADRMEIRRNWDMLMPLGSGSVAIPDWKKHPLLGEPISDDPIRSGPLYEASWTHALHCVSKTYSVLTDYFDGKLYYHVDTYHQLIVHGITGDEDTYHAAHCFEYLRNNILCNADMTLEGQPSTMEAEGESGQAHVCRDRQEAIAWIEARRVDDLQDIVGP